MSIDDVLSQIVALGPADRRRLFRRAQRMALLDVRDLADDAPAATPAPDHAVVTRQGKTGGAKPSPRPGHDNPLLIEPRPAAPAAPAAPPRRASRGAGGWRRY
ncbi:MAG: hypothetical protein HZY76_20685 [Anaerolineae bacterium]|nr:MAG: hypothetical protein HZY76_20685 [Anaerolineae bacterium]